MTPKTIISERQRVTDIHLATIGKAFVAMQSIEMDDNPAYAALEWLTDCRKDLLEACGTLLALCDAAGIEDGRIPGTAVSDARYRRDYYSG